MVEHCVFGKAHSVERAFLRTSGLPWDAVRADGQAGSLWSQENFAGDDWKP